ncbi:hypothetical protein MAPG_07245 [Magnaporthiopsis poae ATCC 64411]|uniref:Cyanovirin-N domain-containing protein n=1 Tax=Magnaporthiopsis poae (strain ATCC 64411 / 73-15) TaxID=644358 RepID=A0A0C4E456_MAGP6|nr:hypothetical protein MAPG_07245 [Magnaporthiopsis poae ATCC 64411]
MPTLKTIVHTLSLTVALPCPTLGYAAARAPKPAEPLVGSAAAAEAWRYGSGSGSRHASGQDASKPIAADRTALHGTATPPPVETVGPLAGGYTQTCYMYDMSNGYEDDQEGHLLACRCYDQYSRWHYTTAHLNERLGNDNGRFVWYSKDYRASCNHSILWKERHYMSTCAMRDGRLTLAEIDLDLYIRNIHGQLKMM